MDYAMRDPAVLYALLGLSNSILSVGQKQANHARVASEYRHQTMVHVQKRLNKPSTVGPTTAYAVALLLRLEVSNDARSASVLVFRPRLMASILVWRMGLSRRRSPRRGPGNNHGLSRLASGHTHYFTAWHSNVCISPSYRGLIELALTSAPIAL